ncbi:hypothetical protein [Actinokineospora sp. HUAS TT18]|uniref:hypothetical protein n=1 Tax=Actinokineospora sp. HUAS TT18 TaxID=3447451 RepID=UPI003F525B03
MTEPAQPERLPLTLADPSKRRGCAAWAISLVFGAALGGVVGLIAGRVAGLVTAAVVAGVLGLVTWATARRTVWLDGHRVVAKAIGTKSVDLHAVDRLELIVTDVRGVRTIGLLVAEKRKTINVSLAVYSGTGGRELGILPLRRLADALAGSSNTAGLVFSQLLVAQLRAEARGEAAPERPLFQLASVAPTGKLAQRLKAEAVTKFVANLP